MAVPLFGHAPGFLPLAEAVATHGTLVAPSGSPAAASSATSASSRQLQQGGTRGSGAGGSCSASGGVGKRSQNRRGLSKFFSKARSFASFDEATLCSMCMDNSVAVLAKQQRAAGGRRGGSTAGCSTGTSAPCSPQRLHSSAVLTTPHRLHRLGARRGSLPKRSASDSHETVKAVAESIFPCSERPDDSEVDVGLMAVCRALEATRVSEKQHAPPSPSPALDEHQVPANEGWMPPVGAWALLRPTYAASGLGDKPSGVEVMQCT